MRRFLGTVWIVGEIWTVGKSLAPGAEGSELPSTRHCRVEKWQGGARAAHEERLCDQAPVEVYATLRAQSAQCTGYWVSTTRFRERREQLGDRGEKWAARELDDHPS